ADPRALLVATPDSKSRSSAPGAQMNLPDSFLPPVPYLPCVLPLHPASWLTGGRTPAAPAVRVLAIRNRGVANGISATQSGSGTASAVAVATVGFGLARLGHPAGKARIRIGLRRQELALCRNSC